MKKKPFYFKDFAYLMNILFYGCVLCRYGGSFVIKNITSTFLMKQILRYEEKNQEFPYYELFMCGRYDVCMVVII